MEQLRRHYVLDVRNKIAHAEKAQQRDEDTLHDLHRLNLPITTAKTKKEELEQSMCNRQEELFKLKQQEADIMAGKVDKDIMAKTTKVQVITKKKPIVIVDDEKRSKPIKFYRDDHRL